MAQKLKDCNIFGVSSDECLNYAIRNRAEWQDRGRGIVAEYVQALTEQQHPKPAAAAAASQGNMTKQVSHKSASFEEEKREEF